MLKQFARFAYYMAGVSIWWPKCCRILLCFLVLRYKRLAAS